MTQRRPPCKQATGLCEKCIFDILDNKSYSSTTWFDMKFKLQSSS